MLVDILSSSPVCMFGNTGSHFWKKSFREKTMRAWWWLYGWEVVTEFPFFRRERPIVFFDWFLFLIVFLFLTVDKGANRFEQVATQGPQANTRPKAVPSFGTAAVATSYLLQGAWGPRNCPYPALCFLSLSHCTSSSKTCGWVPWAHATTLHIWNGPGVFHN